MVHTSRKQLYLQWNLENTVGAVLSLGSSPFPFLVPTSALSDRRHFRFLTLTSQPSALLKLQTPSYHWDMCCGLFFPTVLNRSVLSLLDSRDSCPQECRAKLRLSQVAVELDRVLCDVAGSPVTAGAGVPCYCPAHA